MCIVTFDWEKNDAEQKFRAFEKTRNLSWVVLEVTEQCNLNCKWCFANSGVGEHMPLEQAKKIVDKLVNNNVQQLTVSGGEPTVYPWLHELVAYAHGKGMVVHLNSNGFALTRELASSLKEAGLSQVQINIDSMNPSKHDEVRGRKNSWSHAIEALRNSVDVGLTAVSQTVLTKDNEDEIINIFKLARSLGVQRCRVWDMTPSEGKALENKHLLPTDYMRTLKELADYAQETGAVLAEAGEPFYVDSGATLRHTIGFCVALHGLYMTIT
jgi:MoaA/NifB/PqqE/SkfB family radical SAM enzyme